MRRLKNHDVEKSVTEDFFNQMKTWASQFAPFEARSRRIKGEAEANALCPDAPAYQKKVEQVLAGAVQTCAQGAMDKSRFEFMIQVGVDGVPQDGWAQDPTPVGQCVLKRVFESSVKKEAMFAKPPHPDYWIKLAFDPGVSVAAE
jgi:hypothetical protein